MIEINHLSKSYGRQLVLNDLSLEFKEGCMTGITGRNGSGKSTLLEIMAGVIPPDFGTFCIDGRPGWTGGINDEIGYVPQMDPIIPELSVYDNLLLWNDKDQIKKQMASGGSVYMLHLDSFLKKKAGKLSGGMKKRLSIASVLIRGPRVLMLDEPSSGLDLEGKHDIEEFLTYYASGNRTVIVVSHDISLLKRCNDIYIIKEGKASRYMEKDLDGLVKCL